MQSGKQTRAEIHAANLSDAAGLVHGTGGILVHFLYVGIAGQEFHKICFSASSTLDKISSMKSHRAWQGIRLKKSLAVFSDEEPERSVTLPASWEPAAAAALAVLAPGSGPVHIVEAAERWVAPIARSAAGIGLDASIGERLHRLLCMRRGAPCAEIWQAQTCSLPGFVLNLPAFWVPGEGLDVTGLAEAAGLATTALALAFPQAGRIGVGFADFAGLLARLGIPYDSESAGALAAGLAALLWARSRIASAHLRERQGEIAEQRRVSAFPPAPPPATPLPELDATIRAAWSEVIAAGVPRHFATTALFVPGPVEALLGVETGGIAPAFSPLNEEGKLTRWAEAWLAAQGLSAETALALEIAGRSVFPPPVPLRAQLAVYDAVAPFFASMPPKPEEFVAIAPAASLPPRRRGYTQRISVGGHTLFLRTGEYEDGRLGEISLTLTKASASFRALLDAFAQAVSIGLQHGIDLAVFVEAFAFTRFAPSGKVEGDPAVERATSIIDYVFRHLAVNFLGRTILPAEEEAADTVGEGANEAEPLLPMALPHSASPRARRRALRVIEK